MVTPAANVRRAAAAANRATAASERVAAAAGSGASVGWVRWTWQSIKPGQQPAAVELDDHVVGAGRGGWHELGDPVPVDADVQSDETLTGRVQHHAAGEPETATRLIHSTNLATVGR